MIIINWSNWTTYANDVLTWFIGLFPVVFDAMMANPLVGVPVILVIVGMVLNLVLKFVGALGSNRSNSES